MKPDELLNSVSALATVPADELDADRALRAITELSVAAVGGCDAASVSIARADAVTSRGASAPLAEVLDEIQQRLGEGPGLDAIRTGTIARVGGADDEPPWPNFWHEGRAHGLEAALSIPVRVGASIAGSLNLYGQSRQLVQTDDAELLGAFVATYAAMVLAALDAAERQRALVDQLNQALASRDIIGQAKGIFMAREGCTADEAFDMLRRASQRLNQKLRDVAEGIVESTRNSRSGPPSRRG